LIVCSFIAILHDDKARRYSINTDCLSFFVSVQLDTKYYSLYQLVQTQNYHKLGL